MSETSLRWLLVIAALPLAQGHGNSVHPPAWWDANGQTGLTSGKGCAALFIDKEDQTRCSSPHGRVMCSSCMWYTNWTMLTDGVEQTVAVDDQSPLRTYRNFNFHGMERPPFNPVSPTHNWPGPATCQSDKECNTTLLPGGICNSTSKKCVPGDVAADLYKNHPWRHPGKAPIWSSCGVAGGNPSGCKNRDGSPMTHIKDEIGGCAEGGWDKGPDARFLEFPKAVTTTWRAGSVVEAAWSITANHGGGYSYRLCPQSTKSQPAGLPLDEECFQAHPLDFHGDTQWLQFGQNRSTRSLYGGIKATDVKEGTWPIGSMWRKNPIPACQGAGSGNANGRGGGNQTAYPNKGGAISCSPESYSGSAYYGHASGPQFTPPGGYPGPFADRGIYAFGFGNNEGQNTGGDFLFSIIDELQIPSSLSPGKYTLSFRYDCEQTTQVWSSCANIRIVAADSAELDQNKIPDGPSPREFEELVEFERPAPFSRDYPLV